MLEIKCFSKFIEESIPIVIVKHSEADEYIKSLSIFHINWLDHNKFLDSSSKVVMCVPNQDGNIDFVLIKIPDTLNLWTFSNVINLLPINTYSIKQTEYEESFQFCWALDYYAIKNNKSPILITDKVYNENIIKGIFWVRDLINSPANRMMPKDIINETRKLSFFSPEFKVIDGEELKKSFPLIYNVGKASENNPALIDLRWKGGKKLKVSLIGKGVSFDSGGLNIKPTSGMRLMKKDMAGAAHVLGLAYMIMHAKLPIDLRILLPCVENSISSNAYRPGDVIASRSGISVEIDNTDAEGRLILADAITYACEGNPDLIIDFASLTGAARVALGNDIPALFTNDLQMFKSLQDISEIEDDLLWTLPLYKPYLSQLTSKEADIKNCGASGVGGAITAALFLSKFANCPWAHIDLMGWNIKNSPSKPEGGEAMGIRAVYAWLKEKTNE